MPCYHKLVTASVAAVSAVLLAPASSASAQPLAATSVKTASRSVTSAVAARGYRAVAYAASMKGVRYRYGGTSPKGFDCSGLTQWAYARAGKNLPRTATDQRRVSRAIAKRNIIPGDLMFFGSGSGIYHVGIYAGAGRMWHSPRSGKTVSLVKPWTSSWSAARPS